MDARTSNYIHAQLGYEIGWWLAHWNAGQQEMSRVTDKLKAARGALGRASGEVETIADEIINLELGVKDLAKSATAPVLAEMGAIKNELNAMVNELKDFTNGGPSGPLPGASTSSAGPSTENPT